MAEVKKRIGETYVTNEGYNVEIIECFSSLNCSIRFDCGHVEYNKIFNNIKTGKIKNPNHKSVYGVGFVGVGKYLAKDEAYGSWIRMIERCYSVALHKRHKSYIGCSVVNEWLNYQVFAKWYEENRIIGFHLDKDILVKGNKVYGPDTCCFIPTEINSLLLASNNSRGEFPLGVFYNKGVGKFQSSVRIDNKPTYLGYFNTTEDAFKVYKKAKEENVKRMADKWRPYIKPEVYQAMYNYEVEITD